MWPRLWYGLTHGLFHASCGEIPRDFLLCYTLSSVANIRLALVLHFHCPVQEKLIMRLNKFCLHSFYMSPRLGDASSKIEILLVEWHFEPQEFWLVMYFAYTSQLKWNKKRSEVTLNMIVPFLHFPQNHVTNVTCMVQSGLNHSPCHRKKSSVPALLFLDHQVISCDVKYRLLIVQYNGFSEMVLFTWHFMAHRTDPEWYYIGYFVNFTYYEQNDCMSDVRYLL